MSAALPAWEQPLRLLLKNTGNAQHSHHGLISACPQSQESEPECSRTSLSAVCTAGAFEMLKTKELTFVNAMY